MGRPDGPPVPLGQSWTMLDNTTGHPGNTADQPQHTTNNLYTRPSLATHTPVRVRQQTYTHTHIHVCGRVSVCGQDKEKQMECADKNTTPSLPSPKLATSQYREVSEGAEEEETKERKKERQREREREREREDRERGRERQRQNPPRPNS